MTPLETVFLFGAGFNADASAEAGTRGGYPLTHDLVKACFGHDTLPPGRSIEDLFADAIRNHRSQPLAILSDLLIDADHDVGLRLRAGAGHDENVYLGFLHQFSSATFLTFNYDSLVEMLLLSLNRWRPDDGYGVPVNIELPPYPPPLPDQSESLVLHLHGSLMVYAQEFSIQRKPGRPVPILEGRAEPAFLFDPNALAGGFLPFERALPPTTRFSYPDQRIIAPIPEQGC